MIRKQGGDMAKLMSKSELIQKIAEQHPNNMTRTDVKGGSLKLATWNSRNQEPSLCPDLPNSLLSKSPPQRSGAASIRSQRSQQYLRQSRLERSSGLGR